MATPQKKLGEQAKAAASIQIAVRVLSMQQAAFDPMSKQAQTIRKALDILAKEFGPQEHEGKDLVPTEIAQLMSGMNPPMQGAKPPGPGGAAPGGM